MTIRAPIPKYIGLLALTALLTLVTGVFAAIPMRVVRRVYGRSPFWVVFIAMSAAFVVAAPVQGAFLLVLTLLVGIYAEVEAHGESVFVSGLSGLVTSLGLTAVGATLWLMRSGSSVMGEMRALVAEAAAQATQMNPDVQVDPETLVRTLPSALVITLIVSLGVALIWDRVVATMFRLPRASVAVGDKLRAFFVPDVFVWITAAAVFAAFYKHGSVLAETIGLNVFYTLIALYFFQGVAVIAQGFRTFKVGALWQTIWVVMMILQFYAVAFLGFADFWIDFRSRFQRRPDAAQERN